MFWKFMVRIIRAHYAFVISTSLCTGGFDMFTSTRARTTLALNVLAAILVLILVSGCNTMEGVGEDIAWVGDSLSESAQTDED